MFKHYLAFHSKNIFNLGMSGKLNVFMVQIYNKPKLISILDVSNFLIV